MYFYLLRQKTRNLITIICRCIQLRMDDKTENPTFSELKERFKKMNVLPYPKPRPETAENESSVNAQSTASNSTNVSSATASAHETKKSAPAPQHGVLVVPNFKKPPVSLPRPPVQPRKGSISQQVLPPTDVSNIPLLRPAVQPRKGSISQQDPPPSDVSTVPLPQSAVQPRKGSISQQVSPPPPPRPSDISTVPASNQSSVVPSIVVQSDESIYAELSDDSINPSASLESSALETSYESFDKPSTVLPTPISFDQRRNSHSESLSMSLDTMLPLKCMFFEFETTINEYQRRDPRTIIYPKIKPIIPKITSTEINALQRCSNA